ncbi:hypothetical protein [Pengzhenrongella sicca]|uniref:DNA modification methylase n=1 Tax=Pengzhenrongella sicca TaxID=2819238 RepID=A0A8A4ZJN4_9MICO|nr:hypothetical protein [Pengzhenrongella sicca]QTE29808.1 hypothetical protein J4E96_01875 [Pengzhenrongella sicca]
MATARSSRFAAAAALVLIGVTAGCSAANPITTTRPYAASDGVRLELGSSLTAENLLIITAAEGEPGALIGGLTNRGDAALVVSVAADGAQEATVRVPAGATVLLGTDEDDPLTLDAVAVPPGGVLPVTISTPEGGSEQLSIPVLDGTLTEYATLVPTADPS